MSWPAIAAALIIAFLFIAVVLLFLKNQQLRDAGQQRAQLNDRPAEQSGPADAHQEQPSPSTELDLAADRAEDVQRVLGHGLNSDVESKPYDPPDLEPKVELPVPVKPQPKEEPPPQPKHQPPKADPPVEPKPQPPKEEPPPLPKPQPPKETPPPEPKPQPPKPPEVTVAVPPTKPPVAPPTPKPSSADADAAFEDRLKQSEEDLRGRLLDVPELRVLSDLEIAAMRDEEAATAARPLRTTHIPGAPPITPDAIKYAFNTKLQQAFRQAGARAGLPLQLGAKSQLDRISARGMQTLSKQLRDMGFVSIPGVAASVRTPGGQVIQIGGTTLAGGSAPEKVAAFEEWCKVNEVEKFRGALATMLQMLQVEDAPTRLLLVKELKKVKGPITGAALAMRAVADLSPEVREKAIDALQKRPATEYLPVLLLGLCYPWPPAADHAAYALTKLNPDGAVPKLLALLDQPDPSLPVLDRKARKPMVKEMVRLNHMRNCLLCHAPSAGPNDGLVRGVVPTPGKPLPPAYYRSRTGDFVRADITFLRQDFSVILPVTNATPWPGDQRFDFITRLRPANDKELKLITAPDNDKELKLITAPPTNYPQRVATLYALRKLTGKDGGDSTTKWRELVGTTTEVKGAKDRPR